MNILIGMSKDDFVDMANADSPSGVKFPSNWGGVFAWFTIRFGLGIVVAAVFGIFLRQVYNDLQKHQERLLEAYKDNTKASYQQSSAIEGLRDEIRRQNDIDRQQNDLLQKQTEAIERLRNEK